MRHFRPKADNNVLSILAVALIVVSSLNIMVAINVMQAKQGAAEGMASSSSGYVQACSSFMPQIEGDLYHEPAQGSPFIYDFNATGENESSITYTDNMTLFNVSGSTGIVSFTPTNDDVGVYTVVITATESLCSIANFTVTTFNITNFNDPPVLISLIIFNETGMSINDFPISHTIDLYEDYWYNLSVVADDPDLYLPPPHYESLTYGKIPPGLFVLNQTTGNVTFMPLQSDVGTYSFRFNVIDNSSELDESGWVDVVVHNVNDNPVLENKTDLVGGLGVMTVDWGSPFHYDVNATDEDNDTLVYHVDFINCSKLNATDTNCSVFSIDPATGNINFSSPFSDVGNYTVNYSVTDGNGGSDWYVGSFSISEWGNLPPNITHWEPEDYNVTMFEGDLLFFIVNITDDSGLPFCQWYMDSVAIEGAAGPCAAYQSNYTFMPSYSDSGIRNMTVMVSDGEFVVAHEWRLIVLDKEPPTSHRASTGGMGLGCIENWRCTAWSDCSRQGVQIRTCVDMSECGTSLNMPQEMKYCIYSPNPTCYDGIQNCHSGMCEVLTDCGGPCASCPTCSDGIHNCHANGECETGTDCGGPCAPCTTPSVAPYCGNGVCEAGELYNCPDDCLDFWIDVTIFVLIIILLVVVSILLYVYRKETVLLYLYRRMRGE